MITVGLAVPLTVNGVPADLERSIRLVESIDAHESWHSAWVGDSLLGLKAYDSTVLLSALAARTSRIRLGVACIATLGLRQPLVVAHQWASLDVLSNGRVTLMASAGNRTGAGHEQELEIFDIDFEEKVERFEEYVEFIREVSRSDTVDFTGHHVRARQLDLHPKFLQRPLPIWIVANPGETAPEPTVRRTLGRAARLGDGWLTYNLSAGVLSDRVAMIDDLIPDARRPVTGTPGELFPVGVQVNFAIAATRERAIRNVKQYFEGRRLPRGLNPDDLSTVFAVGTSDDAAEFIASLVEAGATHVTLYALSDDPAEQVALATEHLLPSVVTLQPGRQIRVVS